MQKLSILKRGMREVRRVKDDLSQSIRQALTIKWARWKPEYLNEYKRIIAVGPLSSASGLLRLGERLKQDIIAGDVAGGLPLLSKLQDSINAAYSHGATMAAELIGTPRKDTGTDTLYRARKLQGALGEVAQRFASTTVASFELHAKLGRSVRDVQKAQEQPLIKAATAIDSEASGATFSAFAEGVQNVAASVDQEIGLLWMAALEGNVCGFCADRHGKVYHDGDVFVPIHNRCQCILVPVTAADMGPDGFYDEASILQNVLWTGNANMKKDSRPAPYEKAAGLESPEPWLDF